MIRKVYEVDPMICPRCGGRMRVVAFLTEPTVVDRIIRVRGRRFQAERKKEILIAVCTIGLPDGIARLKALGLKRLNLSVSLNAPDEGLRGELMPATRGVGLDALAAALAVYPQRRNFALAVNYCLMPGLNDGEGATEGIAAFVRAAAPSGRAVVNLIPHNPGSSPIGRAPSEAEIDSFTRRLEAAGVMVKLRSPRGRGLMAACGQLRRQ